MGQHQVAGAEWVTGPLDFSKIAAIRNNRFELGPVDAEIEPHEGNIFLHMKIRFAQLDENARTDLVAASYLEDGGGQQHEPIAILDEKVWRPFGFLGGSFQIIRVGQVADVLLEIPRSAKIPYTLVRGKSRQSNIGKQAGAMPAPPQPALPQAMWCIFDGCKLRPSLSPSADSGKQLQAGEQVEKIRERKDCYYVRTKTGEGWVHRMAFVDSRGSAEQVLSNNPKPNALFVATKFTGPSDFELEIWHGGLQMPSKTLESKLTLSPGNCVVVTKPAANEFTGPFSVFGHAVQSNEVETLFILNNEHELVPLETSSSALPTPLLIGGAATGAAALAVLMLIVRRRARTSTQKPRAAPVGHAVEKQPAIPSINFPCSSCKAKLRAEPKLFGTRVKCPKCGQPVNVPREADVSPPPAASTPQPIAAPKPGIAD